MSDLIDRQAAIDEVLAWLKDSMSDKKNGKPLTERLKDLPSAQPERKGKWIYGENDGQDGWYCSECGFFVPWDYDYYGLDNIDFIKEFVACPHCEAKMESYTGKPTEER